MSNTTRQRPAIREEHWSDTFVGIIDVLYGFGQQLIARGYFTRSEIAGILDVIVERQKDQSPGNSARQACAVGLRDAFARVNTDEPIKQPTTPPDQGGPLQ